MAKEGWALRLLANPPILDSLGTGADGAEDGSISSINHRLLSASFIKNPLSLQLYISILFYL
jgi:hypothetical protein